MAPHGSPDGQVNVADALILQRFVSGNLTPTPEEIYRGDVAPFGAPDSILNAADLTVLMRAIMGQITLDPVNLGPAAPGLTTASGTTNDNPFIVSGTATPGIAVNLYVNDLLQETTIAASGDFSFSAELIDGQNDIYVTSFDGVDEGFPSDSIMVTYDNIIPRTQSGAIIADTVWTPGSIPIPYVITSNLTIVSGSILTLQPGTELRFEGGFGLIVDGTLTIQGSAINPVALTSNGAQSKGAWAGIVVNSTSSNTVINNAVIEYASKGIEVDGVDVIISNSTITNFNNSYSGRGISMVNGAGGLIVDNVIDNGMPGSERGIHLENSSPLITSNTIRNTWLGIVIYLRSEPIINNGNIITNNTVGISISDDYGSNDDPSPRINGNSIYDNTNYNLEASMYFTGSFEIDATGNWWGSPDVVEISSTINDAKQDWGGYAPVVRILPFLDDPNGTAVEGNYIEGYIVEDTALNADAPYIVSGALIVDSDATLTIDPGATLKFSSDTVLVVKGSLAVNGVAGGEVTFTSANPALQPGDWLGVVMEGVSLDIAYTTIEYVATGIGCWGGASTIANNTIRYISSNGYGAGIEVSYDATVSITGNTLINTTKTEAGIRHRYLSSSTSAVENNTIQGFEEGIYVYDSAATITGNIIQGNAKGIEIGKYTSGTTINNGNIITGNDYGIYVQGNGSSPNPEPVVNDNSIYDNILYNYYTASFYAATNTILDATNNWWGTINPLEIAATIQQDNTTVNYIPFLDAEGGSPVTGEKYLYGTLASDVIVSPEAPYEIIGSIEIPEGVTLQINAGMTMSMPIDAVIDVKGRLVIQGTVTEPVTLVSGDPTGADKGDWQGIVIRPTSTNSIIDYAIIEHTTRAIDVDDADVTITNSIIRNYSGQDYGIYMHNGAGGLIANNLIDNINQNGRGIYLDASSPTLQGNTIQNNTTGIYLYGQSNPDINSGNIITLNQTGIRTQEATGFYPHPVINGNSINDNTSSNIDIWVEEGIQAVPINAQGNWWGDTDPVVMATKISDFSDWSASNSYNTYGTIVDYRGYLDGPGGVPVPGQQLLGRFTFHTILTNDVSYTVLGSLYVPQGVTLTINPGITLAFPEVNAKLAVDGTLITRGTDASLVTFTSAKASIEKTKRDWYGIVINNSASNVVIDHALVEYSTYGVYFSTNGMVSNSIIQNNTSGIYMSNLSGAAYINSYAPRVEGNTIKNNDYGINIQRHFSPTITNGNTITANDHGIYIYDSATNIADLGYRFTARPIVSGNNIFSNSSNNYYVRYLDYDYYWVSSYDEPNTYPALDASGNWWGSQIPFEIAATIYDHNSPVVNYGNFLNSLDGTLVPGHYLAGAFTQDTTLLADTDYEVLGHLSINQGATLTVEAGASLSFHTNALFRVDGILLVQGTAINTTVFTSGQNTPSSNDWQGITLHATSTGSVIDHAVVEWASWPVKTGDTTTSIRNSIIRNYNRSGITLGDNAIVENNNIGPADPTGITRDGLYITGNGQIEGNIIYGNYNGIYTIDTANPTITNGNIIYNNENGIRVNAGSNPSITNSNIITGNTNGIYAIGTYSTDNNPNPVVTGNSITDNSTNYRADGFYNASTVTLVAINNWWGTGDAVQIADRIYDATNNPSYSPTVNYTPYQGVGSSALAITLQSPLNDIIVSQAEQVLIGVLNKPATLTLDSSPVSTGLVANFNIPVTLVEGLNTFILAATAADSETDNLVITLTLDSSPPAVPDTGLISQSVITDGNIVITGASGSVEPDTTVTVANARSGESITIIADSSGGFITTLSAQAGDTFSIFITDAVGNTSDWGWLEVTGTLPVLNVNITSPADGALIYNNRVNISGTFQGVTNTGITVNGQVATQANGQFYVNNLSLQDGANTLNVAATQPDGTTDSHSITVTSMAATQELEIDVSPDGGIAPLTVTFVVNSLTADGIIGISVDVDGDSTIDLENDDITYTYDERTVIVFGNPVTITVIEQATVSHTYTEPGTYNAIVRVAKDTGLVTQTFPIVAEDIVGADARLRAIYDGMLNKLKVEDVSGAMWALTNSMQNKHEASLAEISGDIETIESLGEISGGGMVGNLARYLITREEDGQTVGFYLYLIKGGDGVWRIADM